MDAFRVHEQLIRDYRSFSEGFVDIHDDIVRKHVQDELARGAQWPAPWLALNPSFASGGRIGDLVSSGLLDSECERIFRVNKPEVGEGGDPLVLHQHQRDAIEVARSGGSYVLTTGTGSGKSLSYIVPIVDHVLRGGSRQGIQAIVVYPMNALANSQMEELSKFLQRGYPAGGQPVTFARYTGQEDDDRRQEILRDPPDILLTNYVMLELILTRPEERRKLIEQASGLRFLVLDELHTYRGRQGADVAMLVRRTREACHAAATLQCVGTSATMATGETQAAQRAEVAKVASKIFGVEVTPSAVIGETLRRTSLDQDVTGAQLAAAVRARGDAESDDPVLRSDFETLRTDPMVTWIEDVFGLAVEPGTGLLVRRTPTTVERAAEQLSRITGIGAEQCGNAIRATLLAGSRVRELQNGRPLFAFRLHQFLSKGGSVYVTAEPESERAVVSAFQVELPSGRRLYPLAFCRQCGQEYLMANRGDRDFAGETFTARHGLQPVEKGDGYLFISGTHPWPQDPITENRLPVSWLERTPGGFEVIKSRRDSVPRRKWVLPDGSATDSETPRATLAAWIPGAFRFCLACGVSYEATRSSEIGKLVTLDKEGRSSAMSILASSVLRSLRDIDEPDFPDEARKLLTFVDNRQDASLQAGHFNDFALVVQLRSAIYRAVLAAASSGDELSATDLAQPVTKTLALPVEEYAANPKSIPLRDRAQRALRNVIEYRALRDLQYGWRVTLPNLEQAGLLRVDYAGLDMLAAADEEWRNADPYLGLAEPEVRKEIVKALFDEMRRVLALESDVLRPDFVDKLRRESREMLTGLWAVSEREPDPQAGVAIPGPGGRGGPRNALHLTGRGAFGRWLRRENHFGTKLSTTDTDHVIAKLLTLLHEQGYLTQDENSGGYRLNASLIMLRPGDGKTGAASPLRHSFNADQKPRVVPYFRDLYSDDDNYRFSGFRAAEHTAQVRADDRQEREKQFSSAALPLLFCSPTMELGVDIRSLNVVGLRNVPPTPANYAQRSGRAGRSGQPALVMTYCSSGNSHDSYYFERSELMVAGQVQPPRLDLANEDLVRSHVHAIWLAETGEPLGRSMSGLLNLNDPDYPLTDELRQALSDPDARRRAIEGAETILGKLQLHSQLEQEVWWHPNWATEVVEQALTAFDESCTRWRQLYRTVKAELDAAAAQAGDESARPKDRQEADQRWREARQRMELLLNQSDSTGQSDFYPYRYLASEGFLPGYSFPRLPLAAYIPGMRGRGNTWLQRPRFLALSEFGPKALIYHEGARYEVTRINLPRGKEGSDAGEVVRTQARVCESCGYHHPREQQADVCQLCNAPLGRALQEMLHMQTVVTRRRERINADEEERNRVGFEMLTSYRFVPRGHTLGYLMGDVADEAGAVAELRYGDAAEIRMINLGRRRRKNKNVHGFLLDLVKGTWLNEKDEDGGLEFGDSEDMPNAEDVKNKARVVPFVEDRRNILVFRWADAIDQVRIAAGQSGVDRVESTTLQFALERGIEAVFQLEDSELTSELLPDPGLRGRTMFIEAAEGGAGVLRRLQAEHDALASAAREALSIIHVDPDTGQDKHDACVKGCYRCLLSYGNQSVHEFIDRRLAVPHLLRLAGARVTRAPLETEASADASVVGQVGHSRAADLLRLIVKRDLRAPNEINASVAGYAGTIDLVYRTDGLTTAVVVDDPNAGGVPDPMELFLLGWNVIRVPVDEDLNAVLDRNPSVFGVQ